jgi:hypothetical protein
MSAEPAVEWLEPLDWIETDELPPEIKEISELGFAAWLRLLARLRSAANRDSSDTPTSHEASRPSDPTV